MISLKSPLFNCCILLRIDMPLQWFIHPTLSTDVWGRPPTTQHALLHVMCYFDQPVSTSFPQRIIRMPTQKRGSSLVVNGGQEILFACFTVFLLLPFPIYTWIMVTLIAARRVSMINQQKKMVHYATSDHFLIFPDSSVKWLLLSITPCGDS